MFREMRGCSAHPSLSVFRSDVLGFGGWLGGHEWRRSVISSNPPDEATSESESESSAQSVPESVAVSYTHLRAHETPEHLVCRLLLEKKKKHATQTVQHV